MSNSVDGDPHRSSANSVAAAVAIAVALIAFVAIGYASPTASGTAAQEAYNAPPVANDDTLTTEKNTPGTENVLDNDTDPDEGDELRVTSLAPSAEHGTVECTEDGDCTYTPATDYVGADSFDYTVSDIAGASDIGRVSVTVTEPPPPPAPCGPAVCIDNDTVLLAVRPEGHLNVSDGTGSAAGPGAVGLHFIPTGNEATAPGCLCEGWGAADAGTEVTGYANVSTDGGAHNMTVESFTSTDSTARSVVNIQNTLRVTHDYHPSPHTPNLYEVTVTIENITEGTLSDIRYRRVMDWDVEPTPFNEFVTINGGTATQLQFDSNDGFATANPLGARSDRGFTGNFTDAGPSDHGALFDFGFGALGAGGTTSFRIFYGAAADEAGANAAVAAAGAEVFSFGQPNSSDPTVGTPNTFIFAFGGVGGAPIFPTSPPPPAAAPAPSPPAAPPVENADVTVAITQEELPRTSSLREGFAATPGARMRYLVTVTNNGPGVARGTGVDVDAPAGSSFDSVSTDTGSCSGASTVSCSFGNLTPGQQAHVTAVATLAQAGTATATARVRASGPDPAPGNDTISSSVDVTAGPAQGTPVFGQAAVPVVVSGSVCVVLPNTTECVDISTLTDIPVGSVIDARAGRVRLTVARADGTLEAAELYEGMFQLLQTTVAARTTQARAQAASVTEFRLTGGNFAKCTAQPAKAKAKKKAKAKRKPAAVDQAKPRQPVRRLWGTGSGSFRTRGRYSSATVRGTVWLTEDYCNGTLIRVREGTVTVRDLVKNRTVTVTAGKSYFAEAPAPKAAKAKAKAKKTKRKPAGR